MIKTVGLDVNDGAANESSDGIDVTRLDQSWCSMLSEPGESVNLASMIVMVLKDDFGEALE